MYQESEDNITLIKQAMNGDKNAKDKIVQNNIGLIWNIVKKFSNRGYECDDLFQIGAIGLIRAIDKFDLSYDVKFSTYAVPMIIGEIKRFLRDDGLIKVSRNLKETSNKAKIIKEILCKEFGREPTINEIANRMKITSEELAIAIDAGASPDYLYNPIFENDGSPIYLIDKVNNSQNEDTEVVDKIVLNQIMNELDEIERKIIILRFFREYTQSQIAKLLNISQVQVSRLEKRIIVKVRERYL